MRAFQKTFLQLEKELLKRLSFYYYCFIYEYIQISHRQRRKKGCCYRDFKKNVSRISSTVVFRPNIKHKLNCDLVHKWENFLSKISLLNKYGNLI